MLPLSPKPRAPLALFSLRYPQTTVQGQFNSFNHCKCLGLALAFKRFSETPNQTPSSHEMCNASTNPSGTLPRRITSGLP